MVRLSVCQGKSQSPCDQNYENLVGKSAAPLLDFVDNLPKDLGFCFYFKNLFTSPMLLLELQRRGCRGTGSIRENRITKRINLSKKKDMVKQSCGSYEFVSEEETNMVILKWKDRKVVCLASNCHPANPIGHCDRYSKSEHKRVAIRQPNV